MIKKNVLFLITILISFPLISFSAEIHRVECCELNHDITLDDITICGPPIGQPAGCDPETAGCCQKQATWRFNEGEVIGVIATGVTQCWLGAVQVNIDIPTPSWGMVCLLDAIYNVTDAVFWFALSLSIIMGMVVGIFFLTAGGDPRKIEKAKNMWIWIVVGIAVAISAKLIPALVMAIVI